MIKAYFNLIKPGIVAGNLITTAAGFLLASQLLVNSYLLIVTLVGLGLVMASGCAINNYIDRDIDSLMERTKNRELPLGIIAPKKALYFGAFLGAAGFLILNSFTNGLVFLTALIGFFVYVVIYSMWAKRGTTYAFLTGSISGAVPITVGYLAVTDKFDLGALILFLILAIWQMPHSYAIAIRRIEDYRNAKIPVLPIVKGIFAAKVHITFYILLFILATYSLYYFGYAGAVYLAIIMILGTLWLIYSLYGFKVKDDKNWSKNLFKLSLVALLVLSVLISI